MTTLNVFGNKVCMITQPTPWQKKPLAIRKVHVSNSLASRKARLHFTQAAISARGTVGHDAVVAKIASACAGQNHGGKSESERKQVRYEMANASLARQQRGLQG